MDLITYLNYNGKDKTWDEIGKQFNMSGEAARKRWLRHQMKETSPKLKLRSTWQVQTKEGVQWLESYRAEPEQIDFSAAIDKIQKLPKNIERKPVTTSRNKQLALVNLYDLHLDKICIRGAKDPLRAFRDNERDFHDVVNYIMTYLEELQPEMIVLPLGNDLYHTNSFQNTTKKGTQIEYYFEPTMAYSMVTNLILSLVYELASIAPLYIPMIKGNHDEDKVFILGYWLEHIFRDDPLVTVDKDLEQRKYYKYGKNLLGFAHGDKEKRKVSELPLIMAQERPLDWAATTYRKFFCGDLHHTINYQFMSTKDYPGVEVSFLRAMSTEDSWHKDHGWIGVPRTAYVNVFDEEKGEIITRKFNV